MSFINTVCVYCGAGSGSDPAFAEAAQALGRILAENRVGLVYGGASIGLMRALATGVLDHGGTVTGVIPDFMHWHEQPFSITQNLIVTRDMHERKRIMFEHADAFVALPGGIGTLEELVEQMTWARLGRHKKPILILNIKRFWDPLLILIEHMRKLGFEQGDACADILVAEKVAEILPKLRAVACMHPELNKTTMASLTERM